MQPTLNCKQKGNLNFLLEFEWFFSGERGSHLGLKSSIMRIKKDKSQLINASACVAAEVL